MGMVSAGQRVALRDGVLTASIVKTRCSMFRMTSTLMKEHISQPGPDRQVKRHMLGSSHKVDGAYTSRFVFIQRNHPWRWANITMYSPSRSRTPTKERRELQKPFLPKVDQVT